MSDAARCRARPAERLAVLRAAVGLEVAAEVDEAADQQPFFAREPACGEERRPVRDPHPLVDDVGIHRLGPRVLADPFDEVRMQVAVGSSRCRPSPPDRRR